MSRIIALDYETFYHKKDGYSIRTLGTWAYCNHERFNPYLVSVCDGEESWAGELKDFNWAAIDGATLLSHNAAFERQITATLQKKGLAPALNIPEWICTANMTSYLCNRRALDEACKFLLGVQLDKGIRDRADRKTVEDMKAEGWFEDMLKYGRSDVFYCRELFMKHGHKWPEHERRLSEMTIRQGMRGIQINRPLLDTYIITAFQMLKQAESVLPWIAEGRPPTSPKAIAEHCRACSIPGPPVKEHEGEDAYIAWENIYGPKNPWIANLFNWRSINKFLESLYTIKERLMPGDVFSFALKYAGAHTLRWSGAEGYNMQNMRVEPLYRDENGFLVSDKARLTEITTALADGLPLPSYVTFSLDVRKLFTARPGKRMILSDLSQIEPRVLAWMAGDHKKLELMRAGHSPYQAHAVASMGWPADKNLKKENPPLYKLAKARELGLGFQCGWEKFITVAWDMAGLDITTEDPEFVPAVTPDGLILCNSDGTQKMLSGYGYNSKRIVADYRAQNPLVVALWKRLDEAFKGSVGKDFEMTLPSGRVMTYRNVQESWVMKRNPDTGKIERRRAVTAETVKRGVVMRLPLYGGILTENAVQATARDIFGGHLLELDQTSGIDVLFSSHDEAINEVDEHITKRDVEEIMSKTPEWLDGCPIAAEAKEVLHYCK